MLIFYDVIENQTHNIYSNKFRNIKFNNDKKKFALNKVYLEFQCRLDAGLTSEENF